MGTVEYCKGLCNVDIFVDIYIGVEGFEICDNRAINMTNLTSIIYVWFILIEISPNQFGSLVFIPRSSRS